MRVVSLQFAGAATSHWDADRDCLFMGAYSSGGIIFWVTTNPSYAVANFTAPAVTGAVLFDVFQFTPNSPNLNAARNIDLKIPIAASERVFATTNAAGTVFMMVEDLS
jgi:hypothetical protein